MKYTGPLIAIQSYNFPNVYQIKTADKCYVWTANVVADIQGKNMKISFNWDGGAFQLIMKEIEPSYFSGKMFWDNEIWGEVFFWVYQKKEELLLKGTSIENGNNPFDVFVELRPFESK